MNAIDRITAAIEASRLDESYRQNIATMVRDGHLSDAADYLDVLDDAYGLGGGEFDEAFSDQMIGWARELRAKAAAEPAL